MLLSQQLRAACLTEQESITCAIQALNGPTEGFAVIIGDEGRVVGVLTDGDVRRALLTEASLDASIFPHVSRNFHSVSETDSREQVLDLMQAKRVKHVPILDSQSKLLGIHLLHEVIGHHERPNSAIVMCGGLGMRLRPITENIPKPMVKVAGRPILERIALQLVGAGVTRIHLAVNYLSEVIEAHFGDGSAFGCQISYLHESEPLGTGGALGLLSPAPEFPVLVMNGDLQIDFNIGTVLDAHEASGASATVGLRLYSHTIPYGCVTMEGDSIKGISEKPVLERLVNSGIYVFNSEIVTSVKPEFLPITDLLGSLIDSGHQVHGFELIGDWLDVGDAKQLTKARGGS